ncbi:MAG: pentapeptide repeat-containing protein, partial [Lactococcus garvieae]
LDVSPELSKNIKVNLSQAAFFAALHGIEIV